MDYGYGQNGGVLVGPSALLLLGGDVASWSAAASMGAQASPVPALSLGADAFTVQAIYAGANVNSESVRLRYEGSTGGASGYADVAVEVRLWAGGRMDVYVEAFPYVDATWAFSNGLGGWAVSPPQGMLPGSGQLFLFGFGSGGAGAGSSEGGVAPAPEPWPEAYGALVQVNEDDHAVSLGIPFGVTVGGVRLPWHVGARARSWAPLL